MYNSEIIYLIDYIDKSRDFFNFDSHTKFENSTWKIYSFLMKNYFKNKLVTQSSLVMASGLSRATGNRKIINLIKEKKIIQKPRTKSGKSFSLHPSNELQDVFLDFLKNTKYHIAYAMGYSEKKSQKFYFGSSLLSANIIPPPSFLDNNLRETTVIRILAKNNPTFIIMQNKINFIKKLLGIKLEINLLNNDDLRLEIIKNAKRKKSSYDLIAFNFPWTSEIHEKQYLHSLDKLIFQNNFNIKDFHYGSIQASSVAGCLYGLPIEEVASIMIYRKDILQRYKINKPLSIKQLFTAIKKIQQTKSVKYPIAWPAGKGFPIGCSFIEMMGNLGQPMIHLNKINTGNFDLSNINNIVPLFKINSQAGIDALNILKKLLEYSSPDALNMTWDDVAHSYANGEVAVANIWSGRACFFEYNKLSPAYRNSIYSEKPGGFEGNSASTIGGYSLGIPSNINYSKVNDIISVLKYLVSPAMIKYFIKNGVTASPLFSVSNDPEIQELSSSIVAIDEMQKNDLIKNWIRIPIPQFYEITDYIGKIIHSKLSKHMTKTQIPSILNNIQKDVHKLFK